MRLSSAFIAVCVLFSPVCASAQATDPAPAAAQPPTAADASPQPVTVETPPIVKTKRVCVREESTGSRIGARKVCRDVPINDDSSIQQDDRNRMLRDLERQLPPPPLPSGGG